MKLLAPLTALSLLASASAATVRGLIPASTVLPNPSELPADTMITLTTAGELHKTLLRWDNTFVFRNVSEGSYVLDVAAEGYAFSPLRVDVGKGEEVAVKQTWRGRAWSNTGEAKGVPIVSIPILRGGGVVGMRRGERTRLEDREAMDEVAESWRRGQAATAETRTRYQRVGTTTRAQLGGGSNEGYGLATGQGFQRRAIMGML
jgi:hypothetical protein